MHFIKATVLFFLLLQITSASGQVWIGSLPTYYNPSFAGSTDKLRLSSYLSYRKVNFISRNNDFMAHNGISADVFIPRIATGIGLNLSYFSTTIGKYTYIPVPGHSMEAELIAAPKISVNGKYTISPSVSLNYLMNNDKNPTHKNWKNNSFPVSRLHSRLGIMVQNKKFYLGYSTEFENSYPDLSGNDQLADFESRKSLRRDIPQKYYFNYSCIQTGYSFNFSEKRKLSITPQVVWIFSHGMPRINQLAPNNANLTFSVSRFLAGLGYNQVLPDYKVHGNGYTLMLGYQSEKFRLMLTRDFQPIGYTELLNDFHLSLRYLIGSKNNNPSLTE